MKRFLCWAMLALCVGSVFAEVADAARRVRRGKVTVLLVRGR